MCCKTFKWVVSSFSPNTAIFKDVISSISDTVTYLRAKSSIKKNVLIGKTNHLEKETKASQGLTGKQSLWVGFAHRAQSVRVPSFLSTLQSVRSKEVLQTFQGRACPPKGAPRNHGRSLGKANPTLALPGYLQISAQPKETVLPKPGNLQRNAKDYEQR